MVFLTKYIHPLILYLLLCQIGVHDLSPGLLQQAAGGFLWPQSLQCPQRDVSYIWSWAFKKRIVSADVQSHNSHLPPGSPDSSQPLLKCLCSLWFQKDIVWYIPAPSHTPPAGTLRSEQGLSHMPSCNRGVQVDGWHLPTPPHVLYINEGADDWVSLFYSVALVSVSGKRKTKLGILTSIFNTLPKAVAEENGSIERLTPDSRPLYFKWYTWGHGGKTGPEIKRCECHMPCTSGCPVIMPWTSAQAPISEKGRAGPELKQVLVPSPISLVDSCWSSSRTFSQEVTPLDQRWLLRWLLRWSWDDAVQGPLWLLCPVALMIIRQAFELWQLLWFSWLPLCWDDDSSPDCHSSARPEWQSRDIW